ncbi:uncharacterized protein LOC123717618 isoform X2 [Pieris brassicae]|uniref:uncharacterized protein LOC123717618 isoform X2 n=1 Tax=Pieris brassicae TaxID=7116 RepID=UPI001E661C23|nr:uncharacterized protein LOC123717618 isoform X2 [Pieris brassicae]XP_045529657.1 uncharacterized protein LOC123717618 isoform X2 [Pieris brassicae]XP_045529658.1 uncharacterized protein LOC123717618 isoform X2 [Pieris brassicae]
MVMTQAWKRRFTWITEGKLARLWAELVAAVRRRGRGDSDDDEDLGLPRSPPASPPTDKADKRHHAGISQSSCSDGSLLSVGSSEMDEDTSSGHQQDTSVRSDHSDIYNTSEPPPGLAPLSHSAARHKMAVRPRRTRPATRRKRATPIAASALPITPELNEEVIRSNTPEVTLKSSEVTESFSSSTTTKHHLMKEQHQQLTRELNRVLETPSDTRLKSSSLPPGLALSQVVGPSPAKLSVAETHTPRSSIKRSKSSTQDRESSPKRVEVYEERTKYRSEKKYAEESCHEKKTKPEKKDEVTRSSKREESFFSRLLLRKSGKKKKDQTDGDSPEKKKTQYRTTDERNDFKPVERYKSAGQKAFANQMHKRIDHKGAYVHDGAYRDVYSAAKVPGLEYDIDLKVAEETDKLLNMEMKRCSRRDEDKRRSKEIEDRRESFSLHHDKSKRPASVQRLMDPFSSRAFISNEIMSRSHEETLSTATDDEPSRGMRIRNVKSDNVFHGGSMPKNLPHFNPSITVSGSQKPSRSSENVKMRPEVELREKEFKRDSFHARRAEDSYVASGLRSLGDEYVETRTGIGKSHSFRYASESASVGSQENQMPSLPTVVGFPEPLLESWEVNYRRNVERHDFSKRVSARNFDVQGTGDNYDSLPSTDGSYLDSLKPDAEEDVKLFAEGVRLAMDAHKRDSDISQIEAKIDDIIGSPKPIIAPMLKSSSLDSIKSSSERPTDDKRKTGSVESALSQSGKPSGQRVIRADVENFISVTHINKEPPVGEAETPKIVRNEERLHKTGARGVPEFLHIQLNRVDTEPVPNVVLTANVTPKKTEMQTNKEQESESFFPTETRVVSQTKRGSIQSVDSAPVVFEDKAPKPNAATSTTPQSPATPKMYFERKSASVEHDRPEKPRADSVSTDGSSEKIDDNVSMDRKSHSSFGSKSSIRSTDSNENKIPDRHEETVVYRKKTVLNRDSRHRNDDEPELMKVFARRSLKLKDCEADCIAQEIAEKSDANGNKIEDTTRTKSLKNEFNASIKSRDSDKENEEKERTENKLVDIAARVSQFGVPHYQRSVSIHSVSAKRETTPTYRNEVNKYKKEVSDSTPEKRLRNRTFPDPSNDREEIKSITKSESYKADTLRRPWQRKDEFRLSAEETNAVIDKDADNEKDESGKEREEADASPQFKGILQMRAEWEKRAKQGMTK